MSLREALIKCFSDEPNRTFGIQDLCESMKKYYSFTEYQKEDDNKYPQPRYEHEIRSVLAKLKNEAIVLRISRNVYKLAK